MKTSSSMQSQPRLIRVFVSSTFRDMQAERDELVKFIFPQLRKLCEQRGVAWGYIDLRWGITNKQQKKGEVLPICLKEIQRCRPYFIGFLGERYGSLPDDVSPELIESEPWLKEHFYHSVTELEILHGVLNNPEMAKHAFFYFRDPKYLENLPPEQRSAFIESASPEDIKEYGSDEAQRRVEQSTKKLAELKERIRKSGFPVHENYPNPKEFGQIVLRDLTAVIDELYPEGSEPNPLDREAAEHEIFALSRTQVYIGRQTYFDQLDACACSVGEPLVVLGESGSGKSALLANWAIRYRKDHPDELVLMHFIGPGSTDWIAILRRILGELKRTFDIRAEIPDQPDALRSAFANWLNMASAHGRVVLILDALNQLDDHDGAPDLVWLPPHIPENVRLFLSTLPGRPLDELKKRGWPTLTIEPLQFEERKKLIQEYLKLSTRELEENQEKRIATTAQCQNPLFLRVLLDELQQFGYYEHLGDQIEFYLKAPTIPALYELILKRYEQDYERERPGLVRDSVSLLWVARRGLSEVELMELLGTNGQPLPRAYWSPLYLAMEQSFLSRGGLIGFFHDYLRQAVQNKYLSTNKAQLSEHLRLADYFTNREINPRKIDELPWHLAQSKEWRRLTDLLTNGLFFEAVWDYNRYDTRRYWQQIEANSDIRMVDEYWPKINEGEGIELTRLAILFDDTGELDKATLLREQITDRLREMGDLPSLSVSVSRQANLLQKQGRNDEALALHKEGEQICRKLGDQEGIAYSLGNQAYLLHLEGHNTKAQLFAEEAVHMLRKLSPQGKPGLGIFLNTLGVIIEEQGQLNQAFTQYQEAERINHELGILDYEASSLNHQAVILVKQDRPAEALKLLQRQERIFDELGNKIGLADCLNLQSGALMQLGRFDDAQESIERQESICRDCGEIEGIVHALINRSLLFAGRGHFQEALTQANEAYRLANETGMTLLKEKITILLDQLNNQLR